MDRRGRVYGKWTAEDMERAVSAIHRGDMGTNEAAKSYGVPKSTLSRHVNDKNKIAIGAVKFHGHACVLPDEVERDLVEHCLTLESMYFGLRIDDLRHLAYDVAEANGVEHNFNKDSKMAGKKWYYAFMRRHLELSLREPESTSMARAQGFNKPRVQTFFELLTKIYQEEKITPERLFTARQHNLLCRALY